MASSPKYCINGRFLTRPITGVDRYAREIVRELDGLLDKGEAVLLLPVDCDPVDWEETNSIEVRHFGSHLGHAWEQIDLARFAYRHNLLLLNLCNTAPFFNPGIVCIHDMNVRANPSFYGWKFRLYYRFMFWFLTKNAKIILTVSRFSKSEIEKYYPVTSGKVEIAPCAWQHIEDISEDDSVLQRNGLKDREYYFAMSSLAPNKNLNWIVNTARLNSNAVFAVAGGINTRIFGEHDIPAASNVKYLGYVSDAEAKSLMAHCSAFLFPTFYEGFGIPPMEALASGAVSVIVSDNPCMKEVYGDYVDYLNPNSPMNNLSRKTLTSKDSVQKLLSKFSWKKSSEKILSLIRSERV